jgi:hypothetical protein
VAYQSHCDPGEIRTETAARPTSPEKKERLEPGNEKRLGKNPRRRRNSILFLISWQNNILNPRIFK